MGGEDVEWTHLGQDMVQWRVYQKMAMLSSMISGKFLEYPIDSHFLPEHSVSKLIAQYESFADLNVT
jgi:hypothetical protein